MQNRFEQNLFGQHDDARHDEAGNNPYGSINQETKNAVSHCASNSSRFITTMMPCLDNKNGSATLESTRFSASRYAYLYDQ